MAGIAVYGIFAPQTINADLNHISSDPNESTLVKDGRLTFCKLNKDSLGPVRRVMMVVTAYNSDPWQTDDTPLISASGKHVFDGMIAINGLKFGTRVRIPEHFGDRTFFVYDRMHFRKGLYHADVWMANYQDAVKFGAKITEVEIEIPTI